MESFSETWRVYRDHFGVGEKRTVKFSFVGGCEFITVPNVHGRMPHFCSRSSGRDGRSNQKLNICQPPPLDVMASKCGTRPHAKYIHCKTKPFFKLTRNNGGRLQWCGRPFALRLGGFQDGSLSPSSLPPLFHFLRTIKIVHWLAVLELGTLGRLKLHHLHPMSRAQRCLLRTHASRAHC